MRTLYLFIFSIFSLSLHAQTEKYNVLNVVGDIKVKASGKMVAKGDVISSEDQIQFVSADAMAAVFSPSKGRFTLKPTPTAKPSGGEFYAYVKNSIVPATKVLAARSVAASANNVPAPDTQNELCGKSILLLEDTRLPINTETYKLDAEHFFFLRMEWAGEEISKKLMHENGQLVVKVKDILMVDGKEIAPETLSNFRLYHFDSQSKNALLVCSFYPVFPDEAALLEESKILVDVQKAAGTEEPKIRAEVLGYLTDYYGHPASATFNDWYQHHFAQ